MPPGLATEQPWVSIPTDNNKTSNKSSTDAVGVSDLDARLQEVINLEYKDADLSSVLRSLSWTHKLNIVTSPDIKGKVTISLQEITVEKVMEAILSINGLMYSRRGDVIYVSSGDASSMDIITEVVFLKYLTATQAQNLTKKMLSTKGDIKINEVSNNIIVTDYLVNIQKIKELIAKVDIAPKQIIIEAKIIDITSSDLKALGVTWNFDYLPTKGSLFNRRTRAREELKSTFTLNEQSSSLTGGQLAINTLILKGITIGATLDA